MATKTGDPGTVLPIDVLADGDFTNGGRGLYVLVAGIVAVEYERQNKQVLLDLGAGWHPLSFAKILQTGTTATGLSVLK